MDMSQTMPVAWTFSPLWVAALILIAIEEIGLVRLRARSRPERARVWRLRASAYEAGLVIICLIESSPLAGLSMEHLSLHMALHVLEMFYLPIVLIFGAPWVPALFALPVDLRRWLVRGWQLGRARWLTRRISGLVTAPVFGLLVFNATMVAWHLPVVMDWAGQHAWAHTWLMTVSFVGAGYLFWRIILPSHPSPPRGGLGMQAISVVVTAFAMLFLAVAMAVMSRGAWYEMNISMLGASQAFHDQQVAAGILWICGDFWWIPAIVLVVRRLMAREGGLGAAFERSLGREG
jgi:cytochrome c oxidase assembly factor CtaG